jgi:hypothetical protein
MILEEVGDMKKPFHVDVLVVSAVKYPPFGYLGVEICRLLRVWETPSREIQINIETPRSQQQLNDSQEGVRFHVARKENVFEDIG